VVQKHTYVCCMLLRKCSVLLAHTVLNLENYLHVICCILQVSFSNVITPLAELDALQFPLVQACVFPRMVSTSEDVRRASVEAEKRLDSHFLLCRCNAVLIFYSFIWI
jgi:hypothetical protein